MSARMQRGHHLRLLEGATELIPAMVHAIDRAQRLVHVETYIFSFANAALRVAEALERAARRGVSVRLMVDAVGTPHVPAQWRRRFDEAGVQWRSFRPLGRLGLLIPSRWRRLHRKLCVVDGVLGFCGGVNLIDDHDDVVLGRLPRPRLDFALQVSGPLVAEMLEQMELLWWRVEALHAVTQRDLRQAWCALRESVAGLDDLLRGQSAAPSGAERRPEARGAAAALLWRDNLRHRHDIERAYLRAIGRARQQVVIANAYFIPGRRLRRALLAAVQRGVRVRLLIQGKYERFLQYHAPRPVHQALLAAGVEIYEYAPSALHAKVAVVDDRWATVGSSNLDPISLLLAREANVVTTDRGFALALRRRLEQLLQEQGAALDLATLRSRPWHAKLRDWMALALMRAVLFLTGHRY
ncbi:Cardiolipin synthase B [Tepidimonas alkaliphilus]|uniref:Cardiolipin synthase B n=1 Tax=Tepidimonas alkaliphilus TaxID=2588942 RepID=A0A554W6J5_9BURK|nr:cardiolipin synthase ClsB [Tepidimonas alkaliphilus]TSE19190.1 Cardiolipin synthase B [Tepidimonas alkaliphilus]